MSLYNLVMGNNPDTPDILSFIKDQPDFGRFRDCYLAEEREQLCVAVYTRNGGGNRESYEIEIDDMQMHPQYVNDRDDSFDCTYATFWFKVLDEDLAAAKALHDPEQITPEDAMLDVINSLKKR